MVEPVRDGHILFLEPVHTQAELQAGGVYSNLKWQLGFEIYGAPTSALPNRLSWKARTRVCVFWRSVSPGKVRQSVAVKKVLRGSRRVETRFITVRSHCGLPASSGHRPRHTRKAEWKAKLRIFAGTTFYPPLHPEVESINGGRVGTLVEQVGPFLDEFEP
jgi:hypothetical protein